MMNFDDLARGGTAPDAHTKSYNGVDGNGIRSAAGAHLLQQRPHTRATDNDIHDFNIDLKMNRYKVGKGRQVAVEDETSNTGQDSEDDHEYKRAIESFQAAIDDWSGQRTGELSGGVNSSGNGSGIQPELRSPARSGGTAATSTASSRTNSATSGSRSRPRSSTDGNDRDRSGSNGIASSSSSARKSAAVSASGGTSAVTNANNAAILAAYTQNMPHIVLQTSKRPAKAHNSHATPRSQREQRSNANQLNELRAAYGADINTGKIAVNSRQNSWEQDNVETIDTARISSPVTAKTSTGSKLVASLRANSSNRSRTSAASAVTNTSVATAAAATSISSVTGGSSSVGSHNQIASSSTAMQNTPQRRTKSRSSSLKDADGSISAAASNTEAVTSSEVNSSSSINNNSNSNSNNSNGNHRNSSTGTRKSLKRSTVFSVAAAQQANNSSSSGSGIASKDATSKEKDKSGSLLKSTLARRSSGRKSPSSSPNSKKPNANFNNNTSGSAAANNGNTSNGTGASTDNIGTTNRPPSLMFPPSPGTAKGAFSDDGESTNRNDGTVSDDSYGDESYPSVSPPPTGRSPTNKRPISNTTIETNYEDIDWLDSEKNIDGESPRYVQAKTSVVEVRRGAGFKSEEKQLAHRRQSGRKLSDGEKKQQKPSSARSIVAAAPPSANNASVVAEPKSAKQTVDGSGQPTLRTAKFSESEAAEVTTAPIIHSLNGNPTHAAAEVKSSSSNEDLGNSTARELERASPQGASLVLETGDADFVYLDIQESDEVEQSLDEAHFLKEEQQRVERGESTKEKSAKANARPQSRKLYLGSEASTSSATSLGAASVGSKAPRSAGTRYSQLHSNPQLDGSAAEGFETTVKSGATTASASALGNTVSGQKGKLLKMRSFNDAASSQMLHHWQDTEAEQKQQQQHAERPPSRQRSAFPVHLAGTPGATTPDTASNLPLEHNALTADAAAAVIDAVVSLSSAVQVGYLPVDSFTRQAATAPVPYSKHPVNSGQQQAEDVMLTFRTDSEDGGVDDRPSNAVVAPSNRPPSRQKIGALHLFDGRRPSEQQQQPPSLARSNSGVSSLHQYSPRRGEQSAVALAGSEAAAVGVSSELRVSTTRAGGGSLYYNPKEDGFLDLEPTAEKMPFRIKVTYSGRPSSKKTRNSDQDRRNYSSQIQHSDNMRSPSGDVMDAASATAAEGSNRLSPIAALRPAPPGSNMLAPAAPMQPRASSQKDPIRPTAINLVSNSGNVISGQKAPAPINPRSKQLLSLPLGGSSSNPRLSNPGLVSPSMRASKSTSEFFSSANTSATASPRDSVLSSRAMNDHYSSSGIGAASSSNGRGGRGGNNYSSGAAFGGWADHGILGQNRAYPSNVSGSSRLIDSPSPYTMQQQQQGRLTNTSSPSTLLGRSRSASINVGDAVSPCSPEHATAYSDDDEGGGGGYDFDSDDYDNDGSVLTEDSGVHPGGGMEAAPSMQSLALESSLGEDFLSLFAPGPR